MPGWGWRTHTEGRPTLDTDDCRARRTALERPAGAGESPVAGAWQRVVGILSTAGHEESGGKRGRPRPKAKYLRRPIADEYREGKVKSTPGGE